MRASLLLVLLTLAAGAQSRNIAACDLLTTTEIEQHIGGFVAAGQAHLATDTVGECSFKSGFGTAVSVLVRRVPGTWVSEQVGRMRGGATYRQTPGLGDRAFLRDSSPRGAQLCVFWGQYYVQISLLGEARPGVAERLARLTLARLGAGMQVARAKAP